MASIKPYQSKGHTLYRVQVYVGIDPLTGKKRYRSRQGIKTEREARMVANKLEWAAEHHEETAKPKNKTFQEMSDIYWATYVLSVRATTATTVKILIDSHINPSIGKYRIAAITTHDLQKAVNKWFQSAPSNIGRAINYVRSVFQLAMREGMIARDPSAYLVKPRYQASAKSDEDKWWNKEQIARFFQCLDSKKDMEKLVAFKILFLAGLRRGELLALTWSDIKIINEEQVNIHVNKTLVAGKKVNPPKTPASIRTVPIVDAELVDYLGKWKKEQKKQLKHFGHLQKDDTRQLVISANNGGPTSLGRPDLWLQRIIENNGLKPVINLHKTRHSFISNLLLAGVPVPTVQRLAGHSSPDVTLKIYSHITSDSKDKAAQTLASYLK